MGQGTLGVGMVGAGSMARHHLGAWAQCDDARVVAIYNRTRSKADALARAFDIPHVCADIGELLRRDDIQIASIALSHDQHYPFALTAIDAGKHVFCEKPLALNDVDAREMCERAARAGVKTGVQFSHRTSPALIHARELVAGGYLGQVQYFECQWCFDWARDPAFPLVWRFKREIAGAGALADLGVYAIDAARWLVGEFTSVAASLRTYIARRPVAPQGCSFDAVVRMVKEGALLAATGMGDVENEDECAILATFDNGAHGYLRASRLQKDWSLKIEGSRGVLVWEPQAGRLLVQGDASGELETVPVPESVPAPTIVTQFVANILEDADLPPTFCDGMRAQRVMDAAIASAEQGRWIPVGADDPV